MLRELTICAVLGIVLELACIIGFLCAVMVVGAVPWL